MPNLVTSVINYNVKNSLNGIIEHTCVHRVSYAIELEFKTKKNERSTFKAISSSYSIDSTSLYCNIKIKLALHFF